MRVKETSHKRTPKGRSMQMCTVPRTVTVLVLHAGGHGQRNTHKKSSDLNFKLLRGATVYLLHSLGIKSKYKFEQIVLFENEKRTLKGAKFILQQRLSGQKCKGGGVPGTPNFSTHQLAHRSRDHSVTGLDRKLVSRAFQRTRKICSAVATHALAEVAKSVRNAPKVRNPCPRARFPASRAAHSLCMWPIYFVHVHHDSGPSGRRVRPTCISARA